jgi:putative zinc finger/helix-turn-helix YgiT family protein
MTTQPKAKANRRNAPKPRRGRALPDDACPTCGTIMRSVRGKLSVSVNGEKVAVPEMPHLRCPKCGEGLFSSAVARELERRGIDLYRAKYGLLSADEIRAIREHHQLTQAELAQILRLGGNTLSRWEAGRNVQSAAMDTLLRLIRDLPGSLEYLRKHAA